MKISFCTIAFQANKWGKDRLVERPLAQILPLLAQAGYDGAEIWGPHLSGMSEDELADVRKLLDRLNLAAAMISPYFDFTTSDESAARSVQEGLWALHQARVLRARAIRCFTGKVGSLEATDEQWHRAGRSLQTLADASAADGILWALETHGRNLMDTADGTLRLLKLTDRPNVRVIFQPSTFKQDYMQALEALGPYVCHVHGSGYGGSQIDCRAVLGRLKALGFEGYVSVEWMGEHPEQALRREAEALRHMLAGLR